MSKATTQYLHDLCKLQIKHASEGLRKLQHQASHKEPEASVEGRLRIDWGEAGVVAGPPNSFKKEAN